MSVSLHGALVADLPRWCGDEVFRRRPCRVALRALAVWCAADPGGALRRIFAALAGHGFELVAHRSLGIGMVDMRHIRSLSLTAGRRAAGRRAAFAIADCS